jgi:hypothetical protein
MLAVQVRGEGDGGVGGRVGILAPPGEPHRDRGGVTQRPVAITASQSSISWVYSTGGSVPAGHRSVVVLPVRRSRTTVSAGRPPPVGWPGAGPKGSAAAAGLSALLYLPVGIITLMSYPPTAGDRDRSVPGGFMRTRPTPPSPRVRQRRQGHLDTGGLREANAPGLGDAGGDLRTVSGRIGHAGGGATPLRAYTHFLAAAVVNPVPRRASVPAARNRRSSRLGVARGVPPWRTHPA